MKPTPKKRKLEEEDEHGEEQEESEDEQHEHDEEDEEPSENAPPQKKSKTIPAINDKEFKKHAKSFKVNFSGKELEVKPNVNKSGSFGWISSGSHSMVVGDRVVQVQIRVNVTVTGSKNVTGGKKTHKKKKKAK